MMNENMSEAFFGLLFANTETSKKNIDKPRNRKKYIHKTCTEKNTCRQRETDEKLLHLQYRPTFDFYNGYSTQM